MLSIRVFDEKKHIMNNTLYNVAHEIRENCPWMWNLIEMTNGWIFSIRYRKSLKKIENIIRVNEGEYHVVPASFENASQLTKFFSEQPEEEFLFFRPHPFDEKSLKKMAKNRGFLSFCVMKDDIIVSYFFLRCYFIGKCYLGRIVDYRWQGKGLGKLMRKLASEIAVNFGMPVYGTINKQNIASLKSASAVNGLRIIEELTNGDMIVEYLPKIK